MGDKKVECFVCCGKKQLEASLPPGTRVTSGPGLSPRAISESVFLLQPGSVLMAMMHFSSKTTGCLWSELPPMAILVSEGHAIAQIMMS